MYLTNSLYNLLNSNFRYISFYRAKKEKKTLLKDGHLRLSSTSHDNYLTLATFPHSMMPTPSESAKQTEQ